MNAPEITTELLLELALATGSSLDMDVMLRAALPMYARKLSCPMAGILNAEDDFRSLVAGIPRNVESQASWQAAVADLTQAFRDGPLTPVLHREAGSHYFYGFGLKDFGMLVLARSKPFSPGFLRALEPVVALLGRSCVACSNYRLKLESERALRATHDATVAAAQVKGMLLEQRENALSLMEATLEATDNGILVIDRDGQATSANRRFAEMWHIPQDLLAAGKDEELLAHVLGQLADPQQFLAKVKALYSKPEANSRDTLHFTDGRVFARFSHPQRIGDAVVGRVWSFLDITEQHRAEQRVLQLSQVITEELARSEHQRGEMQALLSAIPDLIWMKDPAGIFVSANPAFGQLMGAEPAHIIGKTDHDFFPAELAAQFQADDHAAALRSEPLVVEEWVTYQCDGRRGLLETVKTAVRGTNGQLIGVLGIARDITKVRALMDELETARAAAAQSDQAKSSFLANMSHEIRTPMNAIIGMTDLCLATDLNDRQHDYLSKVKAASESLLYIINDILDFSKIEAGKLQMESIPFVLETVFEQLSDVVALRAERQGIELSYDIDDDSRLLLGDPMRLGQVLINLVTNALKFSAGGNVIVQVKTQTVAATDAAAAATEMHFSVSDEGIGMTAEQIAILFQPFIQADASTTRRFGGTGLGLAISHHIVDLMGGRIWAESTPGQGSTFHFVIQLQSPGPDRRSGIAELAMKLAEHAERPLLVVDDSQIARHVLEHMIGHLGLQVELAGSGAEALARISAESAPDYLACLVDWRMPELDGLATICELREAFVRRQKNVPPMLLVTAYSHHEELESIGAQVDGLLAKPVSARHLYVELARCLGVFSGSPPVANRRKASLPQWSRFRHLDILLVEDIQINQEVICELLGNAGLTVRIANNGLEALDEVARQRPDLILMDCQMPLMDGFAATQRLREQPACRDLPIIALTANAMKTDQEKCFAAGMNAHVAKPIRMELLYAEMARCLPLTVPLADDQPERGKAAMVNALPQFPGIDTAVGLAYIGGRLPLLYRVLKQFRDKQGKSFTSQFAAAQAAGDWEVQVRLAHSLKGVAQTLGALDLGKKAMLLLAAAEANDAAKCAELFPAVAASLQFVVAGLADIESMA